MRCELIRMNHITKRFGDHTVLNNINLSINKGEVCCILGENGAGKSTLMKILAGIYTEDFGEIFFEGKKVVTNSPPKAYRQGIRMIFQECQLLPELTVAQNIFLKNELRYPYIPIINQNHMDKRSSQILISLRSDIDVRSKVKNLSYSQKQMVEIARALAFDAKVIIFDEPTSSLMESETRLLFQIIRRLKRMGVAIIFISHRIEEVRLIADRIVIMRDGKIVDEKKENYSIDTDYFIEKMAGEDYLNRYPRIKASRKKIFLSAENLSNNKDTVKNVSFNICHGEIVGFAGLQGAGKSSIAKLLFGLERKTSGNFFINDKEIDIESPQDAIKHGMVYLSEYVMDNIFIQQNTSYNISIMSLNKFSKGFVLNNKLINQDSRNYIHSLNLKIPYLKNSIKTLSQGMLQKLALSKILFTDSNILILDDPSKNLDIPSKVELYNILNQLTNQGVSTLLISSDIEELIGMCDRIYVMFNGMIVKEINSQNITSAKILYYASGGK